MPNKPNMPNEPNMPIMPDEPIEPNMPDEPNKPITPHKKHNKTMKIKAQYHITPQPKSQKQLILCHLRNFGYIEPLTALREYGCYRLGARIADLRAEGHTIITERVSSTSRITGQPVTFAKYILQE